MKAALTGALLFGASTAKVYFQETFDSDPFTDKRWIVSGWKQDTNEAGELEWSGGNWHYDDRKGLRTTQDAKFYAVSTKFDDTFDNDGKTLVFGMSVKHEQKIDCGGGYVKLLPPDFDETNFNGDTDYTIMFGPDICGYSTKKVHTIFHHNGDNLLKKSDVKCPDDEYTHFYTLIVNPDNTYEIRVDGESKASGNLKEDWEFEQPKEINDPDAKKPDDWVDEAMIDDPEDVKPAGWDDEPETIVDPDASQPEDWDEEEDGKWEAPVVPNPEYKGPWRPKQIPNPEYKGEWEHPKIPNPDYVPAGDVYKRGPIGGVGIEVWQVKSGTVFSDFVLTDSVEDAEKFFESRKFTKEDEEAAKNAYDQAHSEDEDEQEPEDDMEKDEL
jgi:calreticulin